MHASANAIPRIMRPAFQPTCSPIHAIGAAIVTPADPYNDNANISASADARPPRAASTQPEAAIRQSIGSAGSDGTTDNATVAIAATPVRLQRTVAPRRDTNGTSVDITSMVRAGTAAAAINPLRV